LVYHVANKLHRGLSTEASIDDLVSAGTVGLLNAADAFDASRGIAFSTFAVPRIRGAMIDDLRTQDRASRSLRPRVRALNAAREKLAQQQNGRVNSTDVAAELGVDVETVWQWDADVAAASSVSIDGPAVAAQHREAPWQFAADDEPVDECIARQDEVHRLRAALEELPPRERQVLALYYFEELTQSQIAQVLGVTESRVSQLRSQALSRLRRSESLSEALVA
jgi:RNA polymerase sigma factor for flagellar operon FliA